MCGTDVWVDTALQISMDRNLTAKADNQVGGVERGVRTPYVNAMARFPIA